MIGKRILEIYFDMYINILEAVTHRCSLSVVLRIAPYSQHLSRRLKNGDYWRSFLQNNQERYHTTLIEAARLGAWPLYERLWRLRVSPDKVELPTNDLPLIHEGRTMVASFEAAALEAQWDTALLIYDLHRERLIDNYASEIASDPCEDPIRDVLLRLNMKRAARMNDERLYYKLFVEHMYHLHKHHSPRAFDRLIRISTANLHVASDLRFIEHCLDVLTPYIDHTLLARRLLMSGRISDVEQLIIDQYLRKEIISWDDLILSKCSFATIFKYINNNRLQISTGVDCVGSTELVEHYMNVNPDNMTILLGSYTKIPFEEYLLLLEKYFGKICKLDRNELGSYIKLWFMSGYDYFALTVQDWLIRENVPLII